MFVRNPLWNGEQRNRESGTAAVSANLLDMATESAWTLVTLVAALRKLLKGKTDGHAVESMKPAIRRARSMCSELRHPEVGAHEKY